MGGTKSVKFTFSSRGSSPHDFVKVLLFIDFHVVDTERMIAVPLQTPISVQPRGVFDAYSSTFPHFLTSSEISSDGTSAPIRI